MNGNIQSHGTFQNDDFSSVCEEELGTIREGVGEGDIVIAAIVDLPYLALSSFRTSLSFKYPKLYE